MTEADETPDPGNGAPGSKLFAEVKDAIAEHYYLAKPTDYVLASLWVLQAHVTLSLPVVFYLGIGGPIETGKTNFLNLIGDLAKAVKFENVSVAALARKMTNGRAVCIDEITVDRGKEYNEVRDALLRQGYKSNAAPYTRWDPVKRVAEEVPIFGAKAFGYVGSLEPALQSRTYPIASVKPSPGRESFRYVPRNWWPNLGDLPDRLEAWGKQVREMYPPKRLEEIAYSKPWQDKVEATTKEIGANRESELAGTALLVAEIAVVDVIDALKEANKLREIETFSGSDSDRDDLAFALETVAAPLFQARHATADAVRVTADAVRVKQSVVFKEFNANRRLNGERTVGAPYFARLRQELGIQESWLGQHEGAVYWNIPSSFLAGLRGGGPVSPGSPTSPPPGTGGRESKETEETQRPPGFSEGAPATPGPALDRFSNCSGECCPDGACLCTDCPRCGLDPWLTKEGER
jgi:hypothetical protein